MEFHCLYEPVGLPDHFQVITLEDNGSKEGTRAEIVRLSFMTLAPPLSRDGKLEVVSAYILQPSCHFLPALNQVFKTVQKWLKRPAITNRCHSSWKPKTPGRRLGHLTP